MHTERASDEYTTRVPHTSTFTTGLSIIATDNDVSDVNQVPFGKRLCHL